LKLKSEQAAWGCVVGLQHQGALATTYKIDVTLFTLSCGSSHTLVLLIEGISTSYKPTPFLLAYVSEVYQHSDVLSEEFAS
jgi:hypothetical protein